jgi:acyl carrier protein
MSADAPLTDAGLDSLRTVELVSALEERFGITLEDDDLRDDYFASLSGLAALLESKGVR